MSDFLLELRCEEIPARMQAGARAELERLFRKEMAAAGVTHGELTIWSTPRRLALIARDLPEATRAVREELKGPRVGAPQQALDGFLRKTGLAQDQLEDRGGTWFAVSEKPGRATAAVLAEAIPALVRGFAWPKSMRWGAASVSTESVRWVRPLSGIVAILGEDLIDCEVGEIRSAYATLGHRFHHPGEITIGGAGDYQEKLRACHVIVDHAEREALIRERAAAAAQAQGLALVADEGLVAENAGLTEWPVPLLGRFDAAFLDVPPEVIQLTARTNQKYFVCNGAGSKLANAFVCTANIEAADGGEQIVAGNRKVLAARLADARFFWEQDRKKPLQVHAEKLKDIVFHEKLGTVADKVERVAKLARWLVEEGIVSSPERGGGPSAQADGGGAPAANHELAAPPRLPPVPLPHASHGPPPRTGEDLAALAEQAARLCKADLVTAMVGEFPELQGVMGGYYARAEGLPDAVADAIRDHYKPVGQGDEVPTAPVTVAVSLADKLDTLLGFFTNGYHPTGSKDPYALRRSAIAIMKLFETNSIRIDLDDYLSNLVGQFFEPIPDPFRPEPEDAFDLAAFRKDPNIRVEQGVGRTYIYRGDDLLVSYIGVFADLDEINGRIDSVWDGFIELQKFLLERAKVNLIASGFRHDWVAASQVYDWKRAKTHLSGFDFNYIRVKSRAAALSGFLTSDDGANLLIAYKRAANILKKEGYDTPLPEGEGMGEGVPPSETGGHSHPTLPLEGEGFANLLSYAPEPAEAALIAALDAAAPKARAAIAAEDFAAAMAALASLRGPIDAFFDHVTVNDPDQHKRAARLALLARFRDAVHEVADFSKIEG